MFQSVCGKFTKLHFNYLRYFIVKSASDTSVTSSLLAVLSSEMERRLGDHTYFLAMIIAHNSTALCCRYEKLDFPTFKSCFNMCCQSVSQSVSCNTCNMPTSVCLPLSRSTRLCLSYHNAQGTQISFVLNDCVNGCWNSCCLLPIKL